MIYLKFSVTSDRAIWRRIFKWLRDKKIARWSYLLNPKCHIVHMGQEYDHK